MGTLHANSAREMMLRLKSAPMNVPEVMLPLLDLVLVHKRTFLPEKGLVRRLAQVSEVSRMDEQVLLANVFEFNSNSDVLARTDVPSSLIEKLASRTGILKKDIQKEIDAILLELRDATTEQI